MRKSVEEYNAKFKTIRVRLDDYNELMVVHEKTQIPLVGLFHIAVPLLKKKYRIKDNDLKGE